MTRWVAIGALVLYAFAASAQDLSAYLKLRKTYKIDQPASVAALETLVGTRVVEIRGTIRGAVRVGDSATLLLETSDNDTLGVRMGAVPDWMRGIAVQGRLLVRASRSSEHGALNAQLLGAAPESDMARHEAAERMSRPRPTQPTPARTAAPPKRNWQLPASEATPYYAAYIHKVNSRLTSAEAWQIAEGIVGFSIQYGVDARLIMAMVMTESGFNPDAVSRTGARGLGQLMPGTAAGLGVKNAHDVNENLWGTVRLVRGHLQKYGARSKTPYESLVLTLAAYNAGSGAVRRHGGVPPYRETQRYVQKVTTLYQKLCGG